MKCVILTCLMACLLSSARTDAQPAIDEQSVLAVYGNLSVLHGEQQKAVYRSMTAEMRAAVWKYQITSFEKVHQELTPEQHRVISEAVFLIDTGLFLAVNSDGTTGLPAELDALTIKAAFSPDLAAAVFSRIGEPNGSSQRPIFARTSADHPDDPSNLAPWAPPLRSDLERALRPVTEVDIVDCDCNQVQDYCGTGPTSPVIWCNRFPRCKESSWGCGTLWLSACNGTCS